MTENLENCQVVEAPPLTWRQRIQRRLFPVEWCSYPEPYELSSPSGTLMVISVIGFSFLERLRILAAGRIVVVTKSITENPVGTAISNTAAYAATKRQEEEARRP